MQPIAHSPAFERARSFLLAVAVCAAAFAYYDVAVQQANAEGDEFVHAALVEQLVHGKYSLQGTPVLRLPQFVQWLYDRPVHYNPPLYNVVLLAPRALFGPGSYVWLSVLSTALTALLVARITRRHASRLASAFALATFAACPIVYLVTCRIWAEPFLTLLVVLALDRLDVAATTPSEHDETTRRAWWSAALLLGAAALVKSSAIFVLPAVVLLAWRARGGPSARRATAVLLLPTVVTGAWMAFVLFANLGSTPAGSAEARRANEFVDLMFAKHPSSFLAEPLLMNPAYLFGFAALSKRTLGRVAHVGLAALGILLCLSILGWTGASTYHNKYVSTAMPALAVLAGVGFDRVYGLASGRASGRASARAWRAATLAVAAAALSFLLYERSIHAHEWVIEVQPKLYWPELAARLSGADA